MKYLLIVLISLTFLSVAELPMLPDGWRVHDRNRPQPDTVQPGETFRDAPSDAVVLFDGTSFDGWWSSKGEIPWKLENGYMEVVPGSGSLSTKQAFGDIQLHLEWAAPEQIIGKTVQRGNSGIFLMGKYEIQIMDAWENQGYPDGMVGAVYGQHPALVTAAREPGAWQSYDIIFKAPVFAEGKLVSPAYVTVLHNGVLVQNHTEVYGPTRHKKRLPYVEHKAKEPFYIQNHGQPVRFRNIWVRELH